jgi:hypothetical protein
LNSSSVGTACTADPSGEAAQAGPTQPRITTLLARLPLMALSPRGAVRGGTVALASGRGPQRIRTPPISVQSSVRQPHRNIPKQAHRLIGCFFHPRSVAPEGGAPAYWT